MSANNQHIIRKQIIELELPSQQGAWQLQQKASRLFQEKVKEELGPIFDQLNVVGKDIRVPYLEIDLGRIPPSQFEQVFVEKCVEAIQKALGEEVAQFHNSQEKNSATVTKDSFASFFFFLENGTLPWYANFESIEALEEEVWEYLDVRKDLVQNSIKAMAQKNQTVLVRLVRQFSLPFLKRILTAVWEFNSVRFQALQNDLKTLLKQSLSLQEERRLCLALFKNIIAEGKFEENVAESIDHHIKQSWISPLKESEERILRSLIWQQFLVESNLSVLNLTERFLKKIEATSPTYPIDSQTLNHSNSPDEIVRKKARDIIEQVLTGNEDVTDLPKEGWYIENAGLVICAHFFKTLFIGFELVEKEIFKNDDAQNRALALTQYLVTGEERSAEFLLSLNKVLCGVPFSATVDRMIELTNTEKEEAENLLTYLIRYWPILGHSSIESLRNTFLKRKGKLTYEKSRSTWLIQIEKTGFDICVERLPWTISIIKLPWMKEALHVDWV